MAQTNAYDEVPYQGVAARNSHPEHLAMLAHLLGMKPPKIESCRVLELGCAEGGNLVPMACQLPESQFVGIDYSAHQVAIGAEAIHNLGLQNIELLQADIRTFTDNGAGFDFIIAHGIYSWVPADVRAKLFEICHDHLTASGIAYISYSTYPGGHLRRMVREMMHYHTRDCGDTRIEVQKSRELLDFLLKAVPGEQTAFQSVLEWEHAHVAPFPDHHFRHDLLEDVHDAVYFADFAAAATEHGLQYLGDGQFATMLPRNFPADVFETLKQYSASVIEMEQYMDFIRNRTYRETLLCRSEQVLNRGVSADRLFDLWMSSSLRYDSDNAEIVTESPLRFFNDNGGEITTSRPLIKAALVHLINNWPQRVHFGDLLKSAQRSLPQCSTSTDPGTDPVAGNSDALNLAEVLLSCFASGLVDLSVRQPPCSLAASDVPMASPYARLQAAESRVVTNQRHEMIRIDEFQRVLLRDLDGQRDQQGLLARLVELAAAGEFTVECDGRKLTNRQELRPHLAARLTRGLGQLANCALLLK